MHRHLLSSLRKLIVLLIGLPLIALGIILIPLPGPGLLVTLAGFLVLSLEFDWAKRYVDKLKNQLKQITNKLKADNDKSAK